MDVTGSSLQSPSLETQSNPGKMVAELENEYEPETG